MESEPIVIQLSEVLPPTPSILWTLASQMGLEYVVGGLPFEDPLLQGEKPWDYLPLQRMKQHYEGAGFKVKDRGVDVSPETFVAAADDADVIGLSALLTTTMGHMKDALLALDAAGKRPKVKVIVGGAPVTEDFARGIGADGYAADASRAVALAKSLISSS